MPLMWTWGWGERVLVVIGALVTCAEDDVGGVEGRAVHFSLILTLE